MEFVIDVADNEGKRIILTRKKWEEKSKIHPELKNKTFLKNLGEALKNPEQIWEENSDSKNKRCYYKKYSTTSYVKAVVWITDNPCRVISAFETNKIKEETYPNLKRLK